MLGSVEGSEISRALGCLAVYAHCFRNENPGKVRHWSPQERPASAAPIASLLCNAAAHHSEPSLAGNRCQQGSLGGPGNRRDGFGRPGQSNQHRKSSGKSQKDVL
jgi:hypothetical protein